MRKLSSDYLHNTKYLDTALSVSENFDVIKKILKVGDGELSLYYIDGFVKDTVMQKLMMHFLSIKKLPESALEFMERSVPYVETDVVADADLMLQMVLSGSTLLIGSSFGAEGIIIDSRTYPGRDAEEPQGDRVMRGSRDGFVETMIFNTALIRRRIRDCSLTMKYITVGSESKTDIVLCYMKGKADERYVAELEERLRRIKTKSLTMGAQSLAECLIRSRWYNPFPKIRMTERPDSASAQILEGSVAIIMDNSPEVMILPSSIFDFMQETNDFYFPPLTGTYIRLVRYAVFFMTLTITPVWYLFMQYPEMIPEWLQFIVPENSARIPIIVQLFLVEFIIDALRLASTNTPDMLANSLSVVGGLILGDFAVSIGWLIPEVILYMAFVAIANFTQRSYELGYAFKFLRMMLLLLTAIFKFWGFVAGGALILILLLTNKTVNGGRRYLYPLIPFNGRALLSLVVRVKKRDFEG
ncbi:MAG: spore germination protein [Clostridia bacterium]|nr:spore germination protein [Clostridia bacterium]